LFGWPDPIPERVEEFLERREILGPRSQNASESKKGFGSVGQINDRQCATRINRFRRSHRKPAQSERPAKRHGFKKQIGG
jgi:hypothetical protein